MFRSHRYRYRITLAALGWLFGVLTAASGDTPSGPLSIGRPASAADIARWDLDVGPDGTGLPDGGGTALDGAPIFAARCAGCHGPDGRRGRDRLAGSPDDLRRSGVGNRWPYATTLFDYIRRAMPPAAPGSLTDTEVYALTARILHLDGLVPAEREINAETLPAIVMPARARFVPDDRRGGPEVR